MPLQHHQQMTALATCLPMSLRSDESVLPCTRLNCLPQHKVQRGALRHMKGTRKDSLKCTERPLKGTKWSPPSQLTAPLYSQWSSHSLRSLDTSLQKASSSCLAPTSSPLPNSVSNSFFCFCSHSCHPNIRPPPERVSKSITKQRQFFCHLSTRRCWTTK